MIQAMNKLGLNKPNENEVVVKIDVLLAAWTFQVTFLLKKRNMHILRTFVS